MKKKNTFTYLLIGLGLCFSSLGSGLRADTPENYTNNRYPLVRKPLMELPLGSIKAEKRGNRANGQTVSAGDGRTQRLARRRR